MPSLIRIPILRYGEKGARGINSPDCKTAMAEMYLDPEMHFQIKLKVTSPGLVKFQLLLGKFQKALN